MHSLTSIGWTDDFAQKWQTLTTAGLQPARIVADFGTSVKIAMPNIQTATLSATLAHTTHRETVPKVGDWVGVRLHATEQPVVELVIPRRSELARKAAGTRAVKQIVAANIDIAFVLLALDADFNIPRLQRYLYQLSANNIEPVIVLNKADKTKAVASYVDRLDSLGLPVIVSSAVNNLGVADIARLIKPGFTAILLGSSGVGKSTLTNKLTGQDTQQTQAVRASDATGKHTTVHRELFMLPNGGLLIDTPGIRELQLWGTEEDLAETFDDITALAKQCTYKACRHTNNDTGCAIREALRVGTLSAARFANYQKLQIELADLKEKTHVRAQKDNKKSHKNMHKRLKTEQKEIQDEINYTKTSL